MTPRPWFGVGLSLALHAGVLALMLVLISRDSLLSALMIDLRDPLVQGAAPVVSPPRKEPPVRPTPRVRPTPPPPLEERAAAVTPPSEASPPAPSAPAEPVPPPAPVVGVPPAPAPPAPAPAPAMAAEPGREPALPAPPPSRAVVEPQPSISLAGAMTGEPTPRAVGGGPLASGGSGGVATADRGITSGASTGSDRGTNGRGDVSGSSGPRVASVPPGGAGSGVGAEYGPYLAALRQRIQQSVRYPASARRRGLAGTVSVEILILANGTIGDVTLLESSAHAVLDEAALDTIRSLPRMPLPPELLARPLRVRVPVVFQMR